MSDEERPARVDVELGADVVSYNARCHRGVGPVERVKTQRAGELDVGVGPEGKQSQFSRRRWQAELLGVN